MENPRKAIGVSIFAVLPMFLAITALFRAVFAILKGAVLCRLTHSLSCRDLPFVALNRIPTVVVWAVVAEHLFLSTTEPTASD